MNRLSGAVSATVEDQFGFAEMQVVSFADLYAGKIVAALDRQHPRDLFDVRELLAHEGIDDALRKADAPAAGYQKVSIKGGQSPRWRGDGKELFFVSPDAEMMAVDIALDQIDSPGVPHRQFQLKSADSTNLGGTMSAQMGNAS